MGERKTRFLSNKDYIDTTNTVNYIFAVNFAVKKKHAPLTARILFNPITSDVHTRHDNVKHNSHSN